MVISIYLMRQDLWFLKRFSRVSLFMLWLILQHYESVSWAWSTGAVRLVCLLLPPVAYRCPRCQTFYIRLPGFLKYSVLPEADRWRATLRGVTADNPAYGVTAGRKCADHLSLATYIKEGTNMVRAGSRRDVSYVSLPAAACLL